MNESCDIIIPVWNQLEDTRACVDSIRKNTLYPYRLVIIDNASNSKTAEYLKSLEKDKSVDVELIRNERNVGFIKAVNKGISVSASGYVCILNNDTIVTRNWLSELVGVFDKDPLIAIANPSSNTLGQELPEGMAPDEFAEALKPQSGQFVELGSAFGFCMVMRRKLFGEIGLFDEAFGMGNFEDTDLSLRAIEKGYKTVRAFASYVYHREKRSFSLLETSSEDFEKNRERFESKWGPTQRVMVVLKDIKEESLSTLWDILERRAKGKSWVYVISPHFDTRRFFENFSNLTFYHSKGLFFVSAILRIVFKKKKLDVIYSDNSFFLRVLPMFRVFHRAKIEKMKGVPA